MSKSSFKTQTIFSEAKHALVLALPLVLSFLVQQLSPFFSTMMVAHLGKEVLAAQALGAAVFRILIVSCLFMIFIKTLIGWDINSNSAGYKMLYHYVSIFFPLMLIALLLICPK